MNIARLMTILALATGVGACAFPQPPASGGAGAPGMPMPTSGGSSGGSSGSSGSPSSPSSSPSGGQQGGSGSQMPSGGQQGGSGSSGPSGQAGMPSGGSPSGGGDSGFPGSEPLPWPDQGGSGGSLEDLDDQLDDSLGDFDETMGQGSGSEEEIDILDPMGGGSSSSASDQPVFEESGEGGEDGMGGAVENEGVAQRAEAGASGGDSSGGASGSESGGEQGAQGGAGGGGASASGEQGNTATGNADEGEADIIPIPDDVGDGRDDDIVLRQIREAAMKEQDPVLRERLWDEYRRIRDQR